MQLILHGFRYFLLIIIGIFFAFGSAVGQKPGDEPQSLLAEPVLWPSTSLAKVLVSDLPDERTPSALKLSGAKGEIISGQAVFSPTNDVRAATVSITDLVHRDTGDQISASDVKLQWIRYINVHKNSSRFPEEEIEVKAPAPMPDAYWESRTISVKHGTYSILDNAIYILYRSQPVWIEVDVPRDAAPGDYTGTLKVTGGTKPVELPVELHVWDFEIPQKRHLSSTTWWNLGERGGFGDIEPYTEEYWNLVERLSRFVSEHRETDVMGSFEMIEEIEKPGEGYRYDTSKLERFAEEAFGEGIRRIHLHSVGRMSPADTVSGVARSVLNRARKVIPNEENFRKLAALEELAKRRNWEDRFVVAIRDEPFIHHEESYAEVVKRAKKVAPNVLTGEALEAEYLGPLDIYIPKTNHLDMWMDTYKQHQREGAELWFYTSRIPVGKYPNRFIDHSLIKMRVQFWMQYLFDLDGYLFWALNNFGIDIDNPYSQAAVGGMNAPLGNTAIAYPTKDRSGLLGSLRYSAQRDGLEDYEYLWVLEDRLRKLKDRVGEDAHWLDPRQRSLELTKRVTTDFTEYTRDPEVMLETRQAIAKEIEALDSEPLLYVQTSPMEGTDFPEGPRNLGIRGLVHPGAKVTINGDPAKVWPSGYFRRYHFLGDGEPVVRITAEYNGKTRTVTRTFNLKN